MYDVFVPGHRVLTSSQTDHCKKCTWGVCTCHSSPLQGRRSRHLESSFVTAGTMCDLQVCEKIAVIPLDLLRFLASSPTEITRDWAITCALVPSMVLHADASLILILLHYIPWFGVLRRLVHRVYLWQCLLDGFFMYFSSLILCQFPFDVCAGGSWTYVPYSLLPFSIFVSCRLLLRAVVLAQDRQVQLAQSILVLILPFQYRIPLPSIAHQLILDVSWRWGWRVIERSCRKSRSGRIAILWPVPGRGHGRPWGSRSALVCRRISTGVDTSFVRYVEVVDLEKALWHLVVCMWDLTMSEIPPATELIHFGQPFKFFYLPSSWTFCRSKRTFECGKRIADCSVYVGLPNVKVYALLETSHVFFLSGTSSLGVWVRELCFVVVYFPTSVLVLSRFGASSAARTKSSLKHCGHPVYRPSRFPFPWPVLRRYRCAYLSWWLYVL